MKENASENEIIEITKKQTKWKTLWNTCGKGMMIAVFLLYFLVTGLTVALVHQKTEISIMDIVTTILFSTVAALAITSLIIGLHDDFYVAKINILLIEKIQLLPLTKKETQKAGIKTLSDWWWFVFNDINIIKKYSEKVIFQNRAYFLWEGVAKRLKKEAHRFNEKFNGNDVCFIVPADWILKFVLPAIEQFQYAPDMPRNAETFQGLFVCFPESHDIKELPPKKWRQEYKNHQISKEEFEEVYNIVARLWREA